MLLLPPSEYQPALAARFLLVCGRLQELLPRAVVEHMGSSAVAGALSKGDLDVCVLVPPWDHSATVGRLTTFGYVEKVDTLQTPELCMLEWSGQGEEHAVQLVAQGSAFEMFLTFRDALRANADLVLEYNHVKSRAAHLPDAAYREAKSRFIERVLVEHQAALGCSTRSR